MIVYTDIQGKLGNRVWLRSRTGATTYSRIEPAQPRRRSVKQLRAMRLLSSGVYAWRRLPEELKELWRTDPPFRTLSRKNRDADSSAASGYNWFIGNYVKKGCSMEYAAVKVESGYLLHNDSWDLLAELQLPQGHPLNLQIKAKVTLLTGSLETATNAMIVCRVVDNLTGVEFSADKHATLEPGIPFAWAIGHKQLFSDVPLWVQLLVDTEDSPLTVIDVELAAYY